MARFFGNVGYGQTVLKSPGVWDDIIVEQPYFGDVIRNTRRLADDQKVNSDLTTNNSISIVADEYANEHFHAIRYVEWAGTKWEVSEVDATTRPRLILRLGGVYSGPTPDPVTP